MLTLKIGRRLNTTVASIAEAQRRYCQMRDESGEGASTFPQGTLIDGKVKHRISYNGRVWVGDKAVA